MLNKVNFKNFPNAKHDKSIQKNIGDLLKYHV